MTKFNVAVSWSVVGSYDIEANTVEEAYNRAKILPLPTNEQYLDESFEINYIEELDEQGFPIKTHEYLN